MTTLATLREQVRARADMKNSNFVESSELDYYINNSYKELYDLLVMSFEDYYTLPPVTFTVTNVADQNFSTLPSDFYKLRGVDLLIDGSNTWGTMYPFEFNRRNRRGWLNSALDRTYRIVGNRLYINPVDTASGTFRMWYIPKAAPLVAPTDEMNDVNGWDEYVIVDAAIKCLRKEESDTTELERAKAELKMRIIDSAKNRDAGAPKSISDVNCANYDSYLGYWGGSI